MEPPDDDACDRLIKALAQANGIQEAREAIRDWLYSLDDLPDAPV